MIDDKKIEAAKEEIYEDRFLLNGEEIVFNNDEKEEMFYEDEEKELLSVDFATGPEEAVERVADGSCNDEHTSAWDSSIRDCRISEVYRMTGEQIREYFNL